jgi:SOS-response transcriptional repressor LexA
VILTDAQARVLQAVREIGGDGWPVSVREVQIALGYASTQTVHYHLTSLEDAGLLRRSPRHERSGWRPA